MLSVTMKELIEPPLLTVSMVETYKEFRKYTDNPETILHEFLWSVKALFAPCSMYNLQPIDTYLYSPNIWSYLNSKDVEPSWKAVFDTKCVGWTTLKVAPYYMCTAQKNCDGIRYLNDGVEEDTKQKRKNENSTDFSCNEKPEFLSYLRFHDLLGNCDEKIEFSNYLRFCGCLRIYETNDNKYVLEGLLTDGQGQTQTLYRVFVLEDSSEFVMRFFDLEKRIVIWAKDFSVLAKKDEKTKKVVPETVVLEFPKKTIVYNLVAAILRPRYPSNYRRSIKQIKEDPTYNVKRKVLKSSDFSQPNKENQNEMRNENPRPNENEQSDFVLRRPLSLRFAEFP